MAGVWVIAGESSGDGYGAAVIHELKQICPSLPICAMGGEKMRATGANIVVDSTELGIVGLGEVIPKLLFFLRLLKELSAKIIASKPSAVLLIDYPGFNLRLAQRLHKAGIRVVWYISPQVWAWKKGRIPKLAACVDKMLCIFPFEPQVYEGSGLPVRFVGHPLLEILSPLRRDERPREKNLVVLLPGSRVKELKALLGLFFACAEELKRRHPELRFQMPLQRETSLRQVQEHLRNHPISDELSSCLEITVGDAREAMRKGTIGLAASGTVTVEAALLGLPLVVTYRVSWFTWLLGRMLVKLPYLSIINLVMNAPVFEEKLQGKATPEEIVPALEKLLPQGERAPEMPRLLAEFTQKLGGETPVSRKVAEELIATDGADSAVQAQA